VNKAEEFIIPTIRWFLQNGMTIKVVATKKVELPRLYREATEKYAAQVKISPDGREIFNYVAGLPFPNIDPADPLAGAKIMWNQEQKSAYVDNAGTEWITELVNVKGELERTYGSQYGRRMMWTGRLYNDPKPVIPHNPAIRYTEQFGPLFIPNDLKGASGLTFRSIWGWTIRMTPTCTCPSYAAGCGGSVWPTAVMPFGAVTSIWTRCGGLPPTCRTGRFRC
jgi:hypothetical protein